MHAHKASAGTVQYTCMQHQYTKEEELLEIQGDFVHFGNFYSVDHSRAESADTLQKPCLHGETISESRIG